MVKLDNTETTLPNKMTVPLIDKYRVRGVMRNTFFLFYIVLLAGVTWQASHKPNTLPIQYINFSFRMASDNGNTVLMSSTLPQCTLEVVIMANCNQGQAEIILDRAFKTNSARPWTQHFNHIMSLCKIT